MGVIRPENMKQLMSYQTWMNLITMTDMERRSLLLKIESLLPQNVVLNTRLIVSLNPLWCAVTYHYKCKNSHHQVTIAVYHLSAVMGRTHNTCNEQFHFEIHSKSIHLSLSRFHSWTWDCWLKSPNDHHRNYFWIAWTLDAMNICYYDEIEF